MFIQECVQPKIITRLVKSKSPKSENCTMFFRGEFPEHVVKRCKNDK
jgi:hypothetical protein